MAAFFVSLLAVQCVLNALLDLKTVSFLSAPFSASAQTDAQSMANATHVPATFWTVLWIMIVRNPLVRDTVVRREQVPNTER